jgi:hypothetical protein
MTTNKLGHAKNLSKRFNGFWLITIAAVYALLVTDRSPFMTVVTGTVIVCGTSLCVLEQQQEWRGRARRRERADAGRHDDD